MPYAVALADGAGAALARFPELVGGINVAGGGVTNEAVAAALGVPARDPLEAIGLPA